MPQKITLSLLMIFLSIFATSSFAGVIYNNFEDNSGLPIITWPVDNAGISIGDRGDAVHSGQKALRVKSNVYWAGFGIQARSTGALDFKGTNNDRFSFWIYARPVRLCYIYGCSNGTDNTVGVRFYDNDKYASSGFEVWTTQTAKYSQWSKLKILFSQLPPDFNLNAVTKVEFKNYMPGNYYFDDLQVVREDRAYQTFEKEERSGSNDNEYGWKWNDADTVSTSSLGEPAYAGQHSWKLVAAARWSGTGIQSSEKRFVLNNGQPDQTFWNVDLAPEINDRLTFWVYAEPSNGMDNNVSVQFYDNGAHNTDDTKVAIWPKSSVVAGQWSRVSILFADVLKIAPDFNLKNINKIQFQHYWPGTFYVDDIKATGPIPVLKQSSSGDTISWNAITGAFRYRLQESVSGVEGTWKTVFLGNATTYTKVNIAKNFYRVRWEEVPVDANSIIYASPWSDVLEYLQPLVVFNRHRLNMSGILDWNTLAGPVIYEIQSAFSKFGPWALEYRNAKEKLIQATLKKWYRIRAVSETGGVVTGATAWSNPQQYNTKKGFVKAVGTVLKDNDGQGETLVLNGVNLGSAFVIEPWMSGLGQGDTPALKDDWSIRQILTSRFGDSKGESILRRYREAYLNEYDFNFLAKQGISIVRVPFYYRNLQDDSGRTITSGLSQLSNIVDGLTDRGIYVVLDMHGAPGLQSADANTGRADFNKLFASDGDVYRKRTVSLWKSIADQFKYNPFVLGYDLLNEPIGVSSNFLQLADLYDQIYRAIRAVDPNHLIIMEGVWYTDPSTHQETVDWATLPFPQVRNWTNVMYQFHFYHWGHDEDEFSHKAFIDQKLLAAQSAQAQYNVPLMIGEFYGFGIKAIWDYYTQKFNDQKWSWTSWSYKYHDSPSNWGILNHVHYDEGLPNFQRDSSTALTRKLQKYTTVNYHAINTTLLNVMKKSVRSMKAQSVLGPYIADVSSLTVERGQELVIYGKNFGLLLANSKALFKGVELPIISWDIDTIHVRISDDMPLGFGVLTVSVGAGVSNSIDLVIIPKEFDPALVDDSTPTSLPETFLDTFERCNGRPLGTHGCV